MPDGHMFTCGTGFESAEAAISGAASKGMVALHAAERFIRDKEPMQRYMKIDNG